MTRGDSIDVAASEVPSSNPGTADARRVLRFRSSRELADELQVLSSGPVRGIRKWTLPQVCWHLATIIESNLNPGDSTVRTPEQEAKKAKFFGMAMSGLPENLPLPPQYAPPADCGPEQVGRLNAAFVKLDEYPHSHIVVGGCGPVAVDEVRQLHLAHAAHHLSFIQRAERRPNLSYANIDTLIADLRRLERGYVQLGKWSLPQMCWHLNEATSFFLKPGPHAVSSAVPPEGPKMLQAVLAKGQVPDGITAPPHILPPDDCAPEEVEAYIATLEKARTFTGAFPPHRLFGPLSLEQGQQLFLLHAARHLSFLVPTTSIVPVQ